MLRKGTGRARPAVVFDVLGTLVDQAGSLERQVSRVAGLDRLATVVTVLGLSNASRRVLTGLSAASGMRWHQVLSAEDAGTCKPDPAIYELAVDTVPAGANPPFMAAAHAWDLRAAAAAGMRTAYVSRPDGDPPAPDDAFDLHATGLDDLHAKLLALAGDA